MTWRIVLGAWLVIMAFGGEGYGQTIAEKKASIGKEGSDIGADLQQRLLETNEGLRTKEDQLTRLYQEAQRLSRQGASTAELRDLLNQIQALRDEKRAVEMAWLQSAQQGGAGDEYGIWYQPETTLGQLVIDYGSKDAIYLMPAEVAQIKVNVASSLPVPKEAWEEVLKLLLLEKGVGIRQLNPFLKELYSLGEDKTGLSLITNNREQLELVSPDTRVAFVLQPDPAETASVMRFLGKFVHPNNTSLQQIGSFIFIISQPNQLRELLKLYDFMGAGGTGRLYRLITFGRIPSKDMAKILEAVFHNATTSQEGGSEVKPKGDDSINLQIMTLEALSNSLFLVGTREEVERAEKMAKEIDAQAGDTQEKVVFWYTVKHSNPEELAELLEKIYVLLMEEQDSLDKEALARKAVEEQSIIPPSQRARRVEDESERRVGYDFPLPVEPKRLTPGVSRHGASHESRNFVVDPKTGAIVAVIAKDKEEQLRAVLRRLDVPKKMVRIEVLLFEKQITRSRNEGLNLLRLGSSAQNIRFSGIAFNDPASTTGLLGFFLQRPKGSFPAIDMAYNFLLTRKDVQINTAPSVTTVNQTPATITVVEEISINTGSIPVTTNTGTTAADTFTRAQFGTIIEVLPTVHNVDEDDELENAFITMETNITFDTQKAGSDPTRPDVTRRNVANVVRVRNGETVVIGGLRNKNVENGREGIPLLGDIPGFGKLFSMSTHTDLSTEMFIFITPSIQFDTYCEFYQNQKTRLSLRPGDHPEFLSKLHEAKLQQKQRDYLVGMEQFLNGLER